MDTLGLNTEAGSLASAYSASAPLAEAPPAQPASTAAPATSTTAPTCACCQQWDNAKKDPILNQLSAVLRTEWAPPTPPTTAAAKPKASPATAEPSPSPTRSSPRPAAQALSPQDPEEVARIQTLVAAAYEKATAQPGQALDPSLDPSEKIDDDDFINLSGLLDGTQARKRRENEPSEGPDTISVI